MQRLRDVAERFDILDHSDDTIEKILLIKEIDLQQQSINQVCSLLDNKYYVHSNLARVIRAMKMMAENSQNEDSVDDVTDQ